LAGLISSSLVTNLGVPVNPRNDVNSLLYFLNGSVSTANQFYFIKNYQNLADSRWEDVSTAGRRMKTQIHREWSAFAKDDYKISKLLTLNLGVRWEFYASPYIEGGLTSTIIGSGFERIRSGPHGTGNARTVRQGSVCILAPPRQSLPDGLWKQPVCGRTCA
jgi:hypothetical protein